MTSRQRTFVTFPVDNIPFFKQQLLNWASRFGSCAFLDSHGYVMPGGRWECAVGAGSVDELRLPAGHALEGLEGFHRTVGDWLFGHLGFGLSAETEAVPVRLPDSTEFPDLYFFRPRYVILLGESGVEIGTLGEPAAEVLEAVRAEQPMPPGPTQGRGDARCRFTREEYLDTVRRLQSHILRGDCYEINFCQEFFAEDMDVQPLELYKALSQFSPNPGAAYYAFGDHYLLCASPERYLQCRDRRVLSQPVKGTAARDRTDVERDGRLREELRGSAKERSEHVMIVDLVRNDLSKVCADVRVEEREGVYAFPQVHQMISSVTGILARGHSWVDAIRATFPMGSMTGAPKRRVLELTGQYEKTRRGLYSGSVGYVDPLGNFDFNVVIRSILYHSGKRYLSFSTGSAITAASDPEQEYAECLLKAAALEGAAGLSVSPAPRRPH